MTRKRFHPVAEGKSMFRATDEEGSNEATRFARITTSWRELGDGDQVDHDVLEQYARQLDVFERNGQASCVVLQANELPADLEERGGWRLRETAARHASYAGALAARFGDRVDHWITMCRPLATLDQHFRLDGCSLTEAAANGMLDAAHHLLVAHGGAVQVVRAHVPGAEIGVDLDVELSMPAPDTDRTIAGGWPNQWFPHALANGTYPQAMVDAFGWSQESVYAGDESILTRQIDFVSVQASKRAGEMIGRLSSEHGFERFWVLADQRPNTESVSVSA